MSNDKKTPTLVPDPPTAEQPPAPGPLQLLFEPSPQPGRLVEIRFSNDLQILLSAHLPRKQVYWLVQRLVKLLADGSDGDNTVVQLTPPPAADTTPAPGRS